MWESKYGFGEPFIDVDEWRDTPRRHRYVHGGFEGTHTLFSFYFPPEQHYRGRFYQYLEGGAGGHESLIAGGGYPGMGFDWMYDLVFDELGGYLIESNQGHLHNEGLGFANDVELFGASAECARYAKQLAAELYGSPPHHGYVWGGSGGGSRSIYCIENEPEVYDGASPHVIWSGGALGMWSSWGYWWTYARDRRAAIIDATSPGGSGDPFDDMSTDQREALATLYRHGWPRRAESLLWSFGPWLFTMYEIWNLDPEYYSDFWTVPGYLGADAPERLAPYLVDETYKVRNTVSAGGGAMMAGIRMATAGAAGGESGGAAMQGDRFALVLDADLDDPQRMCMAKVTVLSGKAKGRELYISQVEGNELAGFGEMAPDLFDDVEPGDEVHLDNHDFLAFCYLHRHTVDIDAASDVDPRSGRVTFSPEFGGLRASAVDRRPIYPQREVPEPAGANHTGRFEGKMIHVNCALDSMVWPNGVVAYQHKVQKALADSIDEKYRLWFVDNAPHGAPEFLGVFATPDKDPALWSSRMVGYDGVTAEALRQLTEWVEEDRAPSPTTGFSMTDDSGLALAGTAAERRGVQPLVRATANDAARADITAGDTVRFEGVAEQPPGTGGIVVAEWDFEGTGAWSDKEELDGMSESARVTATHTYDAPGTYFAAFRVGAHRDGAKGQGPLVQNLARVRIVVT
jgi:plastocyanin